MLPINIRTANLALRKELPKYFNKKEITRILSFCDNERDRIMIDMLWRTGSRITELLNILITDIDFVYGTVSIHTLKRKGHPSRSIPLHRDFLVTLQAFIEESHITGRLFSITRQMAHLIVKTVCNRAGIDRDRSHPHTFRHSFAVFSIVSRVPIMVVKKWLGHADIASTLIYTQIFDSDTRSFYEEMAFN